MRELSQTEKDVIDVFLKWEGILDVQPFNSYNISISVLMSNLANKHHAKYWISPNFKIIELYTTGDDDLSRLTNSNRFRRNLMNLIYFADYLRDERLIYVVPQEPTTDNDKLEFPSTDYITHPHRVEIDDNDLMRVLQIFQGKVLIPTEFLINYYKAGYKTPDEIRFGKAMKTSVEGVKMAKYALYVTIAIGIISCILSIISICNN